MKLELCAVLAFSLVCVSSSHSAQRSSAFEELISATNSEPPVFSAPIPKEDSIVGIGIVIARKTAGEPQPIQSVLKGSPADKAGIKSADVILNIDGSDTLSLSLEEIVGKIRGPKGSSVTLKIRRLDLASNQSSEFSRTVARDLVSMPQEPQSPESIVSLASKGNPAIKDFVSGLNLSSLSNEARTALNYCITTNQETGLAMARWLKSFQDVTTEFEKTKNAQAAFDILDRETNSVFSTAYNSVSKMRDAISPGINRELELTQQRASYSDPVLADWSRKAGRANIIRATVEIEKMTDAYEELLISQGAKGPVTIRDHQAHLWKLSVEGKDLYESIKTVANNPEAPAAFKTQLDKILENCVFQLP